MFYTLLNPYVSCEQLSYLPIQIFRTSLKNCLDADDWLKCFKIQAIKIGDRALKIKSLNVIEGLEIVSDANVEESGWVLNEKKLTNMSHDDLDDLLFDRTGRFLETHRLEVNLPLISSVADNLILEEARGRKGQKHQNGALMAALAIKGSFLAMAYQGIAVMSGTALIVGKMALLLAAILGLKKLIAGNQEKTTLEIIKTPKYAEEHHHSAAYEDDFHDHRRNYIDGSNDVYKRIYRFQIPEK
ncbi:hypothetical protein GWI33_020040 [Rhynchophorus ferrugineus]|uniref:Uncharacterized protein n=1 Tax=Rhynchophorus ferrugineus TaxID=354439 RepID=A0A834HT70_RHYFE|nr:hypothetical protein GWI33_020040 [Rhynchophorus ferrugineus]